MRDKSFATVRLDMRDKSFATVRLQRLPPLGSHAQHIGKKQRVAVNEGVRACIGLPTPKQGGRNTPGPQIAQSAQL